MRIGNSTCFKCGHIHASGYDCELAAKEEQERLDAVIKNVENNSDTIAIDMHKDAVTKDIIITIRVPESHIINGRTSENSRAIGRMIDMDQFFGMLRDAIDMKYGLELERTK